MVYYMHVNLGRFLNGIIYTLCIPHHWILLSFIFVSIRSILIRHPLERLLSVYLTIFRMTDAHVNTGISSYIRKFWLNNRKDRLEANPNEIKLDSKSRLTLTFRQFVHFLTDCPTESENCEVRQGFVNII